MGEKLTNNFYLYEFAPNVLKCTCGAFVEKNNHNGAYTCVCGNHFTWSPVNDMQKLMVQVMAEQLQLVRDIVGVIVVTSGVRTESDYYRLLDMGYNPSKRSDHFYGVPISGYCYSVGAADIQCADIEYARDVIRSYVNAGRLKVGQVILEQVGSTKWLHVGNDFLHVMKIAGEKGLLKNTKATYMQSDNGGRTYYYV